MLSDVSPGTRKNKSLLALGPYAGLGLVVFLASWVHPAADFKVYFDAAASLVREGWRGVYQPEVLTPLKYHPVTVYLFVPLGVLRFAFAKLLWCGLNAVVFSWCIHYLKKSMDLSAWGVTVGILIVLHGLTWQLKLSNVTILALGLLVIAQTTRGPWLKAVSLSVMILLKPHWMIFVVPLWVGRERGVVARILILLAASSAVPFLGGWESGLSAYQGWMATLSDPVRLHDYPKTDNQSFFALAWRLWGEDRASLLLIWALGSAVSVVLWLVVFGRLSEEARRKFGLYTLVPVTLWIGPLSWIHSQILLLPVCAMLTKKRLNWAWLWVAWFTLNAAGEFVVGRSVSMALNYWGFPLVGFMAILLALVRLSPRL